MSIVVKGHHPLAEVIAKKLFSIESVPKEEQRKMVNSACNSAVKWHNENTEKELAELKGKVEEFRNNLKAIKRYFPPFNNPIAQHALNDVESVFEELFGKEVEG